ncbi:MAG: MGMT family protein [bacterium]
MAARPATVEEEILACVRRIPRGRVMTYGDVGEYAGGRAARTVGRVLSAASDPGVPWHRVVRADGSCAEPVRAAQVERLRAEEVPIDRHNRVDLAAARWNGRRR